MQQRVGMCQETLECLPCAVWLGLQHLACCALVTALRLGAVLGSFSISLSTCFGPGQQHCQQQQHLLWAWTRRLLVGLD